jgi:hypothetical protein
MTRRRVGLLPHYGMETAECLIGSTTNVTMVQSNKPCNEFRAGAAVTRAVRRSASIMGGLPVAGPSLVWCRQSPLAVPGQASPPHTPHAVMPYRMPADCAGGVHAPSCLFALQPENTSPSAGLSDSMIQRKKNFQTSWKCASHWGYQKCTLAQLGSLAPHASYNITMLCDISCGCAKFGFDGP